MQSWHRYVAFSLLLLAVPSVGAAQVLLNQPESVEYDQARDRYLVSNWGDGAIVVIDEFEEQSYFSTQLTRILGLHIVGDVLYCASSDEPYIGLVGFDLATAEMTVFVPISGSDLLNDLAVDDTGHMFITDYWDTKVFRVNLTDHTWTVFAQAGLRDPNGIVFDPANRRMIVTSRFAGYPLQAIDVDDGSVSDVVTTNIPSQDGLALDNEGRLYVSSLVDDAVYRYDAEFSQPAEIVSGGHANPADILFDRHNGVLCVPNLDSDSVDFVPILVTAAPTFDLATAHLVHNYPDPFNAATTVVFSLPRAADVSLRVYDCRGRQVASLIDGWRQAGEHRVVWSSGGLASGVYLCNLVSGGVADTHKMVLVE